MTAPERIALRWEPGAAVTNGPLMTHPDYVQYTRADLVEALVAEAVAKERERCAQVGYRICAETRHVTLGDKVAAAISVTLADSGEDFGRAAIRAGKGE